MKYLFLLVSLFVFCIKDVKAESQNNSWLYLERLILGDYEKLEGRGCCSWHGGQCGCTGGRIVCCDGSYSPSCGC